MKYFPCLPWPKKNKNVQQMLLKTPILTNSGQYSNTEEIRLLQNQLNEVTVSNRLLKQLLDEKQDELITANRQIGQLTYERENLMEIKWVNIAKSNVEEFENDYYRPAPDQRKKDSEKLENKLEAMRKNYDRNRRTQMYHEMKFQRILELKGDPEIDELKKKIVGKFTSEKFASLMGKAYLDLCCRLQVIIQTGGKYSPIVLDVTDSRAMINEAMSIFQSLFTNLEHPMIKKN